MQTCAHEPTVLLDFEFLFPQIAGATIGVLTSDLAERVVPWWSAIAGCVGAICGAPWLRWYCRVLLLGATVGCYCWVWCHGGVPLLNAIARVPWWGAIVGLPLLNAVQKL